MQPYDLERQSDIDAEMREIEKIWGPKVWTDEEVAALNLKEYKPGYYWDDPRHPTLGPVERYMYDHPGPDWRTKSKLRKGSNSPGAWDDSMFSGAPLEVWNPPPFSPPKVFPVSSNDAQEVVRVQAIYDNPAKEDKQTDQRSKTSGFWICRICRRQLALWPRERALRLHRWGLSATLVFCAPLACTNCRVMFQPTMNALAVEDHRPFWTSMIAIWEGQGRSTSPRWVKRAIRLKAALLRASATILRVRRSH